MKKFWNLMLVALVMLGAAACTEQDSSIEKENSEEAGLSFYAEIVNDSTRADLEYDAENKVWNTVWEGNETIVVTLDGVSYNFTNTEAESSKFTCTDEGVNKILGQSVNIAISNPEQSKVGKSGVVVSTDVKAFDNTETIKLEATNSFLRYTYNGEGKVEFSLTYEGGKAFVYNEGNEFDVVAIEGVKGENFVSFNAPAEAVEAQLAYSIDGVACKSTTINVVEGKIYNLGELSIPYDLSDTWGITGAFSGWDATKAQPLYVVGDVLVAYNLTKLNEGFKFVKNRSWDGAKGSKTQDAVASGEWLYSGENDIKTADAAAYDVYFVPARSLYCIVAAGSAVPELPVVEPIEWSLAGSFNGWTDKLMTATDAANLFVAKGVELKSGDEIKVKDSKTWDTSYGGGINNLEANKWMKAYFNGSNIVVAKSGSYDVYFEYAEGAEYSKLYLVEAEADYTAAVEQTANGTLVPDGGDEPEQPEEVTPGENSEWALVGAFSSWVDKTMLTTTDANVVVYEDVELKAATGFLVHKPKTEWADKYGAGNVNYIKSNHYIVTAKDGADMCVEADGTYDVYFNISTKNLYVMEAGADYATATLQTVSGEEPKQEEPEVTEKVVYLKPNGNWTQSNARFAAYFWGGTVGVVWVSMTAVGDGTYEVHLPEGYDYGCNIIFCRMNPSTTANNWNNKWNQTADLKTPTDGKNLYTVKDGTWDNGGGTWSVK
ncbi:MAG: hypothetical protein IKV29_05725 [Alistipes sp.]|nr:hypothetical protein [Alistipes sp.]